MANHPPEGTSDDFFEQILGFQAGAYGAGADISLAGTPQSNMVLQLSSGSMDSSSAHLGMGVNAGVGLAGGPFHGHGGGGFPLGLSLDGGKSGFMKMDESASSGSVKRFRDKVVDSRASSSSSNLKHGYHHHGQAMVNTMAAGVPPQHPPAIRPRVRARRGQATDPHSIAERLRRERIAERIRALQELVPSLKNKTDRAAMLDEIVDYVKFLRLQVKVLSMSRLGGAGAVAPLVTDMPISSIDEEGGGRRQQPAWERWSNDGTERQVAKLMEENVGAAMQFLQSKALCIMPISLASTIYHTQPPDAATSTSTTISPLVKPETNPTS